MLISMLKINDKIFCHEDYFAIIAWFKGFFKK
jgi:hypothetical protein